MKLTPLDIRHKEFKRGMRGYTDVEVDEFLDEVADEFERLFKDSIDLGERVEELESQVAGYKRMEETLQKTLISAQASADELKKTTAKEAELVLHEAELKGRQLVNEAYSERQGIEQSLAKLKSAEQDFRFKFRQLLEGYLLHLEEAPATVAVAPAEGMAQAEFARHAEAIKQAIAREQRQRAGEPVPPPVPGESRPVDREARATGAESPLVAPGAAVVEPEVRVIQPDDTAEMPYAEAAAASPAEADHPPVSAPTEAAPAAGADLPKEPGPDAAARRAASERILFGESDDLLDDVDTGVNENEFKW